MPHALSGFVEQHQVRLERQGGREFQGALAAIGQIRGQGPGVILQGHFGKQLHGAPIEIGEAPLGAPEIEGSAQISLQGHPDILKSREMRKDRANLKGAHDAAARNIGGPFTSDILAAIENAARGWLQELGQQIKEGGLARAVRADQGVNLALSDAHRHAIDRDEPIEVLNQTVRLKDYVLCRHRGLPPVDSWSGCAGTVYARSSLKPSPDGKLF